MLMCERCGLYSSVPKICLAEWCSKSTHIQSNSNGTFHCVYQFGFLCLHTKVDALISFGTIFCVSK